MQPQYLPPYLHVPSGSLNDRVKAFWEYWDRFYNYTKDYLNRVDPTPVTAVAAAASITPLRQVQPISGTANIDTLAVPSIFGDVATLLAEAGFNLVTGGNIAAAKTLGPGEAVTLYLNVRDGLWYPD